MSWLLAAGDALERLGRWLVGVLLIGLLGIVTLQIVDRHFVDVPIVAPDAYARILLVWVTFVGFALAVRGGLAIRVDLLDPWLPTGLRVALELAFDILKLAVVSLLIWKGWLLVEIGTYQSILGTDLTTAVPNAGLWVGSLMLLVFVTIHVAETLARGRPLPQGEARAELRAE